MDRHMPGLDGVEATRLLRQTGFRRPIVAFTAGDQREIEALQAAGCDAVLNKPMDTDHLLALLERTLGRHDGASGTTDSNPDDGLRKLVNQFLSGLPGRQHAMHQALRAHDVASLRGEAHQIKGTAGAMGYPAMTRQAGALEANLKTGDPDWERIRSDLAGLDAMIGRALASPEERT
jgi:HPt (histidine-containing phosphotransfer) domain-containing protein